jgi:hypothetical protein
MTLARLLSAALIICSLPAFTQIQKQSDAPVAVTPSVGTNQFSKGVPQGNSAEPWRLIPNAPANIDSEQDPLDHIRVDQFHFDRSTVDPGTQTFRFKDGAVTLPPRSLGQLDAEATCYAIRSYVVARDSKDSDSTHPVSYSTCQPAARYRVKTTEIRSESVDR